MSKTKYPKQCPFGGHCPRWKLPPSEVESLKARLLAGAEPHGELAEAFGVSRQRVEQLARQIGAPTGREVRRRVTAIRGCKRQRRTEEEVARATQQAQEAREKRLRVASELWRNGASAEEIGKAIGLTPPAAKVYICVSRRSHPELFPYRRTPHHSGFPPHRKAFEAKASKLWRRGKTVDEIVAALGSDHRTIKYLIAAARRHGRGDLFTPRQSPRKRQPCPPSA